MLKPSESSLFLRGLGIGFSIAAPVGPIGILCIRRSLIDGPAVGFATGLGAAVADAMYGCIAAFGLTALSRLLVDRKRWLALLGGGFLVWLGLQTLVSVPPSGPVEGGSSSLLAAFGTTVALTATNPMTVLSFVAIFAGFGVAQSTDARSAMSLVSGVFLGSALWWLLLSTVAGFLRKSFNPDWLIVIHRLSGVILLAFGLRALASLRKV
jgi:threonine/homoserine/homoserine lactone efflux protein